MQKYFGTGTWSIPFFWDISRRNGIPIYDEWRPEKPVRKNILKNFGTLRYKVLEFLYIFASTKFYAK